METKTLTYDLVIFRRPPCQHCDFIGPREAWEGQVYPRPQIKQLSDRAAALRARDDINERGGEAKVFHDTEEVTQ